LAHTFIDPALLEPSRFPRIVRIDYPDEGERDSIFRVHLREMPLEEDVDPALLAHRTPGFPGARIRNLVNEAALLAVNREKKRTGMAEFDTILHREGEAPAEPPAA
jgi:cell division protease FtsH